VLVPTFYSPYLAEDFNNVIGSRPGGRWGAPNIYGKKVYYAHNYLRARAKRAEVTDAFREGLKDLRADQMVKVFFVPAYLLTEVAELIEAHKDKKYFRMTRQIKTGAFYAFSIGVI
jgi:hypothetical protein